jgi:hypothetical protein
MALDPTVNQIISAAQAATLTPDVIVQSGAGKAYQSVAQSAAIAVQDATDALRNITTVSTTAAGVVIAQMLAGDEKNASVLQQIENVMTQSVKTFADIGEAAAKILTDFPR